MSDSTKLSPPDFNVGIDCEDIDRWRKMLPKLLDGFRRGLFTAEEHKYCRSFKDPAPHYAARWCAKEALMKALSPFVLVDLREVEIANDDTGRPFFRINNKAVSGMRIRLSMSHSKKTAIAVVMVSIPEGIL